MPEVNEPYLKSLGRTAVRAVCIGLVLGVAVNGLVLLLFWLGIAQKIVCK